jgi:hypothetical protein
MIHSQKAETNCAHSPPMQHVARSRCAAETFTIDGLHVLWPKAAANQLLRPGCLGEAQRQTLHRSLAATYPPA